MVNSAGITDDERMSRLVDVNLVIITSLAKTYYHRENWRPASPHKHTHTRCIVAYTCSWLSKKNIEFQLQFIMPSIAWYLKCVK